MLQADAELRIEGSSYRPRSAYTRTAVHRTSARLPLHDRLSECVNQLPPFAPRIRSANSIGPLRTLHQGQLGDRRGPLRATADWRGTYSDLGRIAACTTRKAPSTPGTDHHTTRIMVTPHQVPNHAAGGMYPGQSYSSLSGPIPIQMQGSLSTPTQMPAW